MSDPKLQFGGPEHLKFLREHRQPAAPRFVCPGCKALDTRILELNTALVELPVMAWDANGQPEQYDSWEIITESIETIDGRRFPRYRCAACKHEFEEPLDLNAPQPITCAACPNPVEDGMRFCSIHLNSLNLKEKLDALHAKGA